MLLPSDIARLVLGYLQQEKLSNTCRAFILESGDLKEYAEHSTEDGLVPACLLSLFGKNLKTILNEYVIMKARDSMPEAPAVLPSLWRKLEYTLLQIRSLQQSSVALATNQRARTKNALSELRRRGSYSSRQVAKANSSLLSISPQTEQRIIKPLSANPIVITHSTGTSPVIPQPRPDVFANQICSQDPSRPGAIASGDVLHIVVPGHCDRRLQPEHISPGKRKCDSPRKRGNFVSGQNSTSRSVENEVEESQVEIAVENFPQRVIENAREKILKDRSLLEKLAENINKVMFSETNAGHPSKPPDTSSSLPEQSIDEILGLGDEVHMSDEAIQDILEQTESDPAFQALFDLFDYGKSKRNEDGVRAPCSQELEIIENSASSAPSDVFNTCQTEEMVSLTSMVPEKGSSGYKKKSKADGTVHKNKMSSESNSTTKSTKRENLSFPTFSTTDINKPTLSMNSQMTSSQASRCSCWTAGEASSVSDLPSSVTTIHTTLAMSECQEAGNIAEMEIEAQSSSIYHEKAKLSPLVRQELSEDRLGIEELTNHNGKAQSLSKLTCQTGLAAEANKSSLYDKSKAIISPHKPEQPTTQTICGTRTSDETDTVVCNVLAPACSEASSIQSTSVVQKRSECEPAPLDGRKPLSVNSDNSSVTTLSDQQNAMHTLDISKSLCLTNILVSTVPEASNSSTVSSSSVNSLKSAAIKTCVVSAEVELHDPAEPVSSSVSSSKSSSEVKGISLQPGFGTSGLNSATVSANMVTKSPLATTSAKTDISTSKMSNAEPSSTMEIDPTNIVTLKIIISDDPKQTSSDPELSNAVSSIINENVPTIVLSSPGGTPLKGKGLNQPLSSSNSVTVTETNSSCNECVSTEETERAINSLGVAAEPESSEQHVAATEVGAVPTQTITTGNITINIPQADGTLLSTQNPVSLSNDTGLIQLLPATTPFGQSNSVLIATCVQDSAGQSLRKGEEPNNGNTFILGHRGNSTNVLMLPSSSASATISTPVPQVLSTPPRPSTVFTMGQPVSSSFSQGSTFIITSPVQPVLQGMMGVIPVSIMGPNNGTSFTVSPQQVLRMPVPSSLGKKCNRFSKLPISRKPPQLAVQPSPLNTGQSSVIGTFISIDSSISQSNSRPQRGENSDLNIPVDQSGKSREHPAEILNASSSKLKPQRHRRVLCFDNATAIGSDQSKVESNTSQEKKENRTDNINQSDRRFSSQSKERSERTDTRVSKGREMQGKLEKNKNVSSGPSYDSFHKTTANKENEASRDQVRPRGKETSDLSNIQIQKKGSHSERPNSQTTIADKDGMNKIPESQQECKKGATALAVSQETTSKRNPDKSDCFSLTSTLTKQAAEMLQDMQRQSPVPKQTSNADLAVPRTPGSNAHEGPDDSSDFQRTPRNKGIGDDKASPRVMVPPTTPDIPTCSPASEAGSENSVSMAAHTLMILSRAAIARTTGTTPLKDNTCQIRSPLSQTKKRKLEEREEEHRQQSLSSRLDLQNSNSPGKKKRSKSHKHKRKKHLDSFPVEMDVDKFLSSLQYDE
ncbi:protein NPAT isoform X2 [Scyliorhinus canicula]|uniref:protein NPAT isoform X2 n=1 Tax=Scyliorhinus canicula TaxID=7830 RepID=UPI0018F3767D|nr:protein NPAT isoform X2 [Scyliorhinus canicula]